MSFLFPLKRGVYALHRSQPVVTTSIGRVLAKGPSVLLPDTDGQMMTVLRIQLPSDTASFCLFFFSVWRAPQQRNCHIDDYHPQRLPDSTVA